LLSPLPEPAFELLRTGRRQQASHHLFGDRNALNARCVRHDHAALIEVGEREQAFCCCSR